MQSIRKGAIFTLDCWAQITLSPLEEWKAEYAGLQAQLDKLTTDIRKIEIVLKDFHTNAATSDMYADYHKYTHQRAQIYQLMWYLDDEQNKRAWYHATRRRLLG